MMRAFLVGLVVLCSACLWGAETPGISSAHGTAGPALTTASVTALVSRDEVSFEELVARLDDIAQSSPYAFRTTLATSGQGRGIPVIVFSSKAVGSDREARKQIDEEGAMGILLMGGMDAGETAGTMGLLALARDLSQSEDGSEFAQLVIAIAPIFDVDGHEDRAGPATIDGEEGEAAPMDNGVRDLNRDCLALEYPETRGLVRFVTEWKPAIIVGVGSALELEAPHRYDLTYDVGNEPNVDPRLVKFVRGSLMPAISARALKSTGVDSFFEGKIELSRKRWVATPPDASDFVTYFGFANRIGIRLRPNALVQDMSARSDSIKSFVESLIGYVRDNKLVVWGEVEAVKRLGSKRRNNTEVRKRGSLVTGGAGLVPSRDKIIIKGFAYPQPGQVNAVPVQWSSPPKDYEVLPWVRYRPGTAVHAPWGYLIPESYTEVIQILQRHGIKVEQLREDREMEVEINPIINVVWRETRPGERPRAVLSVMRRPERRLVEAGTILIRIDQDLAALIGYLLEPGADNGLTARHYFDDILMLIQAYPIERLLQEVEVHTAAPRPLPEDRQSGLPISYEVLYGARRGPNFSGSTIRFSGWLDDGDQYLQVLDGNLKKVSVLTGDCDDFLDVDRFQKALESVDGLDEKAAKAIAERTRFTMTDDRSATLIQHKNDLYFASFDGVTATRLTESPQQAESMPALSPDGRFVAFHRDHNIHVVDVETRIVHQLTTDGTSALDNGRASWVYYEEVLSRNWQAYWWSPQATHIAFLQTDTSEMRDFSIIDNRSGRHRVQSTRYPRPGEVNPTVRVGIVSVPDGEVRWVDLPGYEDEQLIVSRVGWWPDGERIYLCVMNRVQTWMDLWTAPVAGGEPRRLLRDENQAWVDRPAEPFFLKDGSFILSSDRSGYRHLHRFAADGAEMTPVTSGAWQTRRLHDVDEDAGWVYFDAMRDSPVATNFYRIRLDGSSLQRLTNEPGSHRVQLDPTCTYFIDTWSTSSTPTRLALRSTDSSELIRTLDANPVYLIEEYEFGEYEQFQITLSDGFKIEASLIKPPDFDPDRQYPVWFSTYAGPKSPTIRDTWSGGRTWDQMLAQMGFIVFRCDPRSASGKSARSAWTAFGQLGVQELADIEEAIGWLTAHPWVDSSRIGMNGHSYGGFMTAFAMTHSTIFAAGIAGAPVTDWRDYDTIYTERYMGTPQDNPEGYEAASVVAAAENLQGNLLIVHGMLDDNVHFQNTVRLVDALQKAGRPFELMVYPGARHGIGGRHYRELRYNFIRRLLDDDPAQAKTSSQ